MVGGGASMEVFDVCANFFKNSMCVNMDTWQSFPLSRLAIWHVAN
jgi:hypothetical protein